MPADGLDRWKSDSCRGLELGESPTRHNNSPTLSFIGDRGGEVSCFPCAVYGVILVITHGNSPFSPCVQVHYLTLQSNIGEGTDLEWQITNINDVIKPTFNYYFSRFGH